MQANEMGDIEQLRKDFANLAFEIVRNIEHKGRKLAIATRTRESYARGIKLGGGIVSGVSQESWDSNKGGIHEMVEEALKQREFNERKESWIVKALTGKSFTLVASGEDGNAYKLTATVPREVWSKIARWMWKADSEEEVEGLEDFGGRARGWITHHTEEAQKILTAEAEKVATEKDREIAALVIKKREEDEAAWREDKRRNIEERQATLDEAKELAKKYKLRADWSWDDYRFRVGEIVEEAKYWTVQEYRFADNPFDHGENFSKERLDGYVLKQKNERRVGIVGFGEFGGDALAQTLENPPAAVKAVMEGMPQ